MRNFCNAEIQEKRGGVDRASGSEAYYHLGLMVRKTGGRKEGISLVRRNHTLGGGLSRMGYFLIEAPVLARRFASSCCFSCSGPALSSPPPPPLIAVAAGCRDLRYQDTMPSAYLVSSAFAIIIITTGSDALCSLPHVICLYRQVICHFSFPIAYLGR